MAYSAINRLDEEAMMADLAEFNSEMVEASPEASAESKMVWAAFAAFSDSTRTWPSRDWKRSLPMEIDM